MKLKRILLSICLCQSLLSIGQDKFAIVSAYGMESEPAPTENNQMARVNEYFEGTNIANEAVEENLDKILNNLGSFFDLVPAEEYKNESYYKYLLDEYEYAPEDLGFSLGERLSEVGAQSKTNYRMSKHQVAFYNGYIAIGTFQPFDNREALKNLFEKIPTAKGFIFLEFDTEVTNNETAQSISECGTTVNMYLKVFSQKNKKVLQSTIVGRSSYKFPVSNKSESKKLLAIFEPSIDHADVKKSYASAIDNLISKLDKKLTKKISKMKF